MFYELKDSTYNEQSSGCLSKGSLSFHCCFPGTYAGEEKVYWGRQFFATTLSTLCFEAWSTTYALNLELPSSLSHLDLFFFLWGCVQISSRLPVLKVTNAKLSCHTSENFSPSFLKHFRARCHVTTPQLKLEHSSWLAPGDSWTLLHWSPEKWTSRSTLSQ